MEGHVRSVILVLASLGKKRAVKWKQKSQTQMLTFLITTIIATPLEKQHVLFFAIPLIHVRICKHVHKSARIVSVLSHSPRKTVQLKAIMYLKHIRLVGIQRFSGTCITNSADTDVWECCLENNSHFT